MKTFEEWLIENNLIDEGFLDYLGKNKTIRNAVVAAGLTAGGLGLGRFSQAAEPKAGPQIPRYSATDNMDQSYINNAQSLFKNFPKQVYEQWYNTYMQKKNEMMKKGNDASFARQSADQIAKDNLGQWYMHAVRLQQTNGQYGDKVQW